MTNRYITVTLTDHDCAGRTPNHVLACSHTRMPAAVKDYIYKIKRRKYADLREVRRA